MTWCVCVWSGASRLAAPHVRVAACPCTPPTPTPALITCTHARARATHRVTLTRRPGHTQVIVATIAFGMGEWHALCHVAWGSPVRWAHITPGGVEGRTFPLWAHLSTRYVMRRALAHVGSPCTAQASTSPTCALSSTTPSPSPWRATTRRRAGGQEGRTCMWGWGGGRQPLLLPLAFEV